MTGLKILLSPEPEQRERVRAQMLRKIEGPSVLHQAKKEASPAETLRVTLLTLILERLTPAYAPTRRHPLKWAAAFAIVLVVLRALPSLFLAPTTIADSSVLLIPTDSGVELSLKNLWQPVTNQLELSEPVVMRTSVAGPAIKATVMLHDDGNLRLGSSTLLLLQDLTDRPEPAFDGPTATLMQGELWVQSLLPDTVRGMTIATPFGDVVVHGGSVSIYVGDTVQVRVWDRHAVMHHEGQMVTLVAGERVDLWKGNAVHVQRIALVDYNRPWVSENLGRDAVHQRELAQLQQERRSAAAGILPNSPLYSVKRAAEAVDVLLTIGPEARVQKKLQQASTRLDEAAALLAGGQSGAGVPLAEYKQALIDVATGSGGSAATQQLIAAQVADNAAQLSASLPDDSLYPVKQAVLEVSAQNVEGTILIDTLDVLHQSVVAGDTEHARESLLQLKPYLAKLRRNASQFSPEVKKEAFSLLNGVRVTLSEQVSMASDTEAAALQEEFAPYIASTEQTSIKPAVKLLTDDEIQAAVDTTMHEVFDVYRLPKSRLNALRQRLKHFAGSPDEGRYLRKLYHDMPEASELTQFVRHAIQVLREKQILE